MRRNTILIAEDDQGCRSLISTILGEAGYDTVDVARGSDAQAAARRVRPDLVILDIDLPGLTGYEVCSALRTEFGERLPIIFISGKRAEPLDRVAGRLIGADEFVAKPFRGDDLLAAVRGRLAAADGRSAEPVESSFALTPREFDVLRLLCAGLSPKDIGRELVLARKTVSTHIQHILSKLNVHSQAQAVSLALVSGLVHFPSHAPTRG
jgi:DNA-binding NarL/FixJ family response regulator